MLALMRTYNNVQTTSGLGVLHEHLPSGVAAARRAWTEPQVRPAGRCEVRSRREDRDPRRVEGLRSVRLRKVPSAFGPVDLTVEPGAFVTFLGPSGCGKSTLLLMIAGLLPPSHGAIRIDGAAVAEPRTDIGIMFQDNTLVPWRSVRRNIELQLELRGLDPHRYARAYRRPGQDGPTGRGSRIGRPTSFRVACSSAPPSARRSFTSPRRCFSTSRSASSTR